MKNATGLIYCRQNYRAVFVVDQVYEVFIPLLFEILFENFSGLTAFS